MTPWHVQVVVCVPRIWSPVVQESQAGRCAQFEAFGSRETIRSAFSDLSLLMFTLTNCSVSQKILCCQRAISLLLSVKKKALTTTSEFAQILFKGLGSQIPLLALYCLWKERNHNFLSRRQNSFYHPSCRTEHLKKIACAFANGFLWWLNSRVALTPVLHESQFV